MNEKETISYIINASKNIAIFALSPDKTKASYRVAEFIKPLYKSKSFDT